MGRYRHLSIEEREEIMCMLRERRPLSEIARAIGRDKSTVSREAARNGWTVGAGGGRAYRASRVTEPELRAVYDELNRRPRRRLGYRTPFEVYYDTSLHLI